MKQVDTNTNSEPDRASKAMDNKHLHERQSNTSLVVLKKPSSYHRLIDACKQKDLKIIKSILSERPELANQKDKHNRTLLHYAVILLLDDYANNYNPQQPAKEEQLTEDSRLTLDRCLECFGYLTDHCDLKLWWQQDLDGLSVLHFAVISSNVPLVRHIIFDHPYSIKYPLVCTLDNELHSPLHWAVITNNLDCVKLLIGYAGTKLAHEPDLNGATPLHYATQTSDYPRYRKQLRLMLNNVGESNNSSFQIHNRESSSLGGCNGEEEEEGERVKEPQVNIQNRFSADQQPDHQLEILEYLVRLPQLNLECMDKDRRTPLLWAASSGNRDAIVLLASSGANLVSYDINGLSALHCAASHGFTDCLESLLSLNLITNLQVNQRDNLNCTPLFYGVLSGNIDCVETLLERGAKQDWQDSKGRTAAHFAALKGQLNSLKLLHERGANLWLANKQGDLPLHYAIKSGRLQLVRWLLEHSPYEHAVNAINNFGRAPIHLAILKDNLQMTDYLIRCGANLNQLVKIRDKCGNNGNGSSISSNYNKAQQVAGNSGSIKHRTKNGLYHYETALDMAKNLGHQDCLQLLVENNAIPATQVICNRVNNVASTGTPGAKETAARNGRSLFDLQSVDRPSPIGFETCSSNGSPSIEATKHQLEEGERKDQKAQPHSVICPTRVPKLSRPVPDSLPQTDSTGSSALSQNSLTSVRGLVNHGDDKSKKIINKEQPVQYSMKTFESNSKGSIGKQVHDDDNEGDRTGKPYRGGISYNNKHINASIKCKVYERDAPNLQHTNRHSFPLDSSQRQTHRKSTSSKPNDGNGRASQSAPSDGVCRSQEIVTNVRVYTSPCPHCIHHQVDDECITCLSSSRHHKRHQSKTTDHGQREQRLKSAKLRESDKQVSESYSNESSYNTETETEDIEQPEEDHLQECLARDTLTGQATTATTPAQNHHQQPLASGFVSDYNLRHLPPSQSREQHLPVIFSDREERSTSEATSHERSVESANELLLQETRGSEVEGGQLTSSTATEEIRFDRAPQRSKTSQRLDKYRDLVRSPVADYIHAPLTHQGLDNDHHQMLLNKAVATTEASKFGPRQSNQKLDFSQVKAKVDSHREPEFDLPLRSKSLSMLPNGGPTRPITATTPQGKPHLQPFEETGSRSLSRQTVIKSRRLSVDSGELASSVEKSIRKYKQETKLFEELQNLKRNQIRSGRANEAMLVKRLIEHFRNDHALDFTGLDSYHGGYTYKAYERYLYDQLRKLSHSNCVKLSNKHFINNQQTSTKTFEPTEFHSYLDDDLKAELELRRVMSADESGDDFGSFVLEPSGALEEIRSKQGTMEGENTESREYEYESRTQKQEVEREWITRDDEKREGDTFTASGLEKKTEEGARSFEGSRMKDLEGRASVASSLGLSRRSSIEIEKEKLLILPLKVDTSDVDIEQQASCLSSAILVDALSNVSSKADSPTLLKQQTKELLLDSVVDGRLASDDTDEQRKKEVEGTEADVSIIGLPIGRRRSVVNIGNKLEVIYHNVGIEIDPAADFEPESEHEQKQEAIDSGKQAVSHDKLENAEKIEPALELNDDEDANLKEQIYASLDTKDKQVAGSSLDDQDRAAKSIEEEKESRETTSKRRELPEASGVISQPEQHTGVIRRASSPQAYKVKQASESGERAQRAQRAHSIAYKPADVDNKKVFTGYDLDEMHRSLKRRPPIVAEDDEHEGSDTVKVEMEKIGRRISERASLDNTHAKQIGGVDDVSDVSYKQPVQTIGAVQQQQPSRLKQVRVQVPPIKRRFKRLRMSAKDVYKLKVPIEDIKRRWARIRAEERQKARSISDGQIGKKQIFGVKDKESLILPIDQVERDKAQLAKSQPNLEKSREQEETDNKNSSAHTNYILIYEINKRAIDHDFPVKVDSQTDGHESHGPVVGSALINKWCHSKIMNIVDVRTLKRTLSLPESLIYSNDLLKRFNILKL